jgi:shikimate dehydrogenase
MTKPAAKVCIIGWPAKHSRSPLVHNYWLRAFGLEGSYEIAEVAPEDFADFLRGMAAKDFVGANVTIPHKERAFELCDFKSETAQRLRAVNTLWIESGKIHGDNTDVTGFLAALDAEAPGWDRPLDHAVVLGAGGAARAVLYGLMTRGAAHIHLVNRSQERAQELARDLGGNLGDSIEVHGWQDVPALLPKANLLVNTTSLGMAGQPRLEIDLSALPPHAVVDDIVYVPLETELLAKARLRGLRTVGGLTMLLHQAVPGFEKWFGRRPEVTPELRALIEADVEGRAR